MTPHLQLLLKMADLWAAHIQAAVNDNPGDAETQQELDDLLILRNQVLTQFNAEEAKQKALEDIPQRIIAYLQQNDPGCLPATVSKFDKNRWVIDSQLPLLVTSYQALEVMFPEQLVLNWSPGTHVP